MRTKNYKSAQAEMLRIANAYSVVFDCVLIARDMETYARRLAEYREQMKQKEIGQFNFCDIFYIRKRGVEHVRSRVAELHDVVLAQVCVSYNKTTKTYDVSAVNMFANNI